MRPTGAVRTRILLVAVLAAIVVAGAALIGPARFEGVRWSGGTLAAPTLPPVTREAGIRSPPAFHAPPATSSLDLTVWLVVAAILAAGVAAFLLWRWWRRRLVRTGTVADVVEAESVAETDAPDAPTVRRGLDYALDVLTEDREPDDAIVAAWIGLQDAAGDSGVARRPAETPTEFTSRILGRFTSDRSALETVLGSYLAVRFGHHRAGETEVRRTRDAVAALIATWRPGSVSRVGTSGTDAGGRPTE